jgi:hypothetical protein
LMQPIHGSLGIMKGLPRQLWIQLK